VATLANQKSKSTTKIKKKLKEKGIIAKITYSPLPGALQDG